MKTLRVTVEASEIPSRFPIGAPVDFMLQGLRLAAKILAVKFMTGKVLYHLAVYTGNTGDDSIENRDKYGIVNAIGWDEEGKCYVRLDNIDSVFVEDRT